MPPKEAAPEAEAGRVLAAERLRHTVMPQVVMEPILAMLTVPLLARHMADTVQVAMVVVVTVVPPQRADMVHTGLLQGVHMVVLVLLGTRLSTLQGAMVEDTAIEQHLHTLLRYARCRRSMR